MSYHVARDCYSWKKLGWSRPHKQKMIAVRQGLSSSDQSIYTLAFGL